MLTVHRLREGWDKQEAELQALQQEPRDARAQDGDAGTGIRRRPAARNAEEDRCLSRRIDAAQFCICPKLMSLARRATNGMTIVGT